MKDHVQNVIHDNKHFNDISVLEFVGCQCSNNTGKCEQYFVKDLVKNQICDNKRLDDIILLQFEFVNVQIILENVKRTLWKILLKMSYMINVWMILVY